MTHHDAAYAAPRAEGGAIVTAAVSLWRMWLQRAGRALARGEREPLAAPPVAALTPVHAGLVLTVLALLLVFPQGTGAAFAQVAVEPPVQVPGFWDPRRRPERPDLQRVAGIRFLTEIDYPPFNFAGPDGNPQGFNIDLARMLCEELKLACTVQMRRFETLLAALNQNRGDA